MATGGFIYLTRSAQGVWTVLDPADALPSLTFTAGTSTSTATIDAYTFASPYSQWRAPLAGEDVSALTAMLRSAWSGLLADVAAEGRHAAPMLVRWAVRMVDGNYLWMSDPVRVGDETLANTDRLSLSVTTSGNNFTGTAADVLPCVHYALVINVVSGIAPAWRPLVAAIDVLATDEASLFTASRSLDYRCLTRTVGPRDYLLEVRLTPSSAAAVSNRLAASPWRLIATAPASATSGADFTAPVEAVMDSGASSVRTVEAVQLYGDPLHAVAVLANGAVLDLEQEQPAAMSVGWRSHPVAVSPLMGERVQRVVWHLSGEDLQLTLRVTGQRGIMASEWPVSVMAVDGDISQPLAAAPMRIAARTLCFAAEGTAPTGTMFMKTLIYCR